MTKKVLFYGVGIIAVVYLSIGVVFYLQDAKYSRGVYVCSGGETQHINGEDCAPQPISLVKDWPTALTITVGWLPLIIAQGIVSGGQPSGEGTLVTDPRSINSFAECAAAGYAVMESHPRQCHAKEIGKTFTEIIHTSPINSFKECVTAGYPAMNLNPRECNVPGIEKAFVEVINAPTTQTPPSIVSDKACVTGGCSGQICQDASEEGAITTCEFRPEYACYRTSKCERQTTGKCGWTQTSSLTSCLKNPPSLN